MAEVKYLDLTGLGYYDGKIKEYILSQVGGGDVTIDALKAAADGAVSIEWTKGGTKQADVVLSHADLIAAIGEVDATEAGLMSVADKAKLDAIEAGAQVNVIESISINGEAFAVADKAATATMTFDWEAEGSDNIVLKIGETEIGKIDTTKFVKDGIVEDAELITIPGDEEATDGRPAGKYIKITWSGSATTDPTYINVTDLVDIHNVVGDATQSGSLVKVNTAVTGSGTTTDPWKVSVAVDETALQSAIDGIDTGVASLDGAKGDITVAKDKTGMGEVSFTVSEDGELSGTVANVGVQNAYLGNQNQGKDVIFHNTDDYQHNPQGEITMLEAGDVYFKNISVCDLSSGAPEYKRHLIGKVIGVATTSELNGAVGELNEAIGELNEAINGIDTGVLSLGGKTGEITLDSGNTATGKVNFSIDENNNLVGNVNIGIGYAQIINPNGEGGTGQAFTTLWLNGGKTSGEVDVYFSGGGGGPVMAKANMTHIANEEIDALFA